MHRPFRFAAPPPGPYSVLRPRLLAEMSERWHCRLVTLEAGAGMGKTTLLSQAIAENRLDSRGRDVWLSCEPSDSSAPTFLGAVLEALGAPLNDRREPCIDDVRNAIWAEAPLAVCLVLDDAHALQAGSTGAACLAKLVEELPENGRLLIAGRSLPDLPIARLVSQHRARSLRDNRLCFDGDELQRFADTRGVATRLFDGIGGWPAIAELRASSGAQMTERYLRDEVLATLSHDDREAFALISAVGGGDSEVLRAAVGLEHDITRLAELPLVTTDGRGGLKPHALWAELGEALPEQADVAQSRQRVAEVLRRRGENAEAFELLARANDWTSALDPLFDACNDQQHPPWPDTVRRWRNMMPSGYADRPEVLYLDAYIARCGDPWSDAAWNGFRRSIAIFSRRGDQAKAVSAEVRMLWTAWLRGEKDTIREVDEHLQRVVPGRLGRPFPGNLALLADIDGDFAELRAHATRMRDESNEARLRHFPGIHRTSADLAEGRADGDTAAWAAEAADAGRAIAPAAGSGWAALAPIVVAWARGQREEVLTYDLRDPGPQFSIAERVPHLATAVIVAAHLGRVDDAAAALVRLREVSAGSSRPGYVTGYLAVAEATALVCAGDEERASQRLRTLLDPHEFAPVGAGRAILWFPAVPYILDQRCRSFLDATGSGATREPVIAACRTLLDGRIDRPPSTERNLALLDDGDALIAALPVTLAVELATLAHARRDPRGAACIEALAVHAASAVRDCLRRVESTHQSSRARKAAGSLLAAIPLAPGYDVRVDVLGPVRLRIDAKVVHSKLWRRERVRQLLVALVAHREIRRTRLGALLWPDFGEAAVSANLRMTLSYLQSLLEPDRGRGDAPWFLRQDAGVLCLGGPRLSVDAWDVERLLGEADRARADGTPTVELACLLTAIDLWVGDYLDDVALDEWAAPVRARFLERMSTAGVRAGELLVASGRTDEALRVATRVLEADPWCEPAYRVMLRAHLGSGNTAAARRTLDACCRMLDELGVAADPATRDLELALAR